MKMIDHVRARRTIRQFTPHEIPADVRDSILEAGMWAPSHGNAQPWEFLVIGPETRAKLLPLLQAKADELLGDPELPDPRRKGLLALRDDFGNAAWMVAVVSRAPADDLARIENPLSAAAAVQNMSLAAWDAGIGSVWLSMGAAPPVRTILGVAEEETVVAILAMGHPADVPPAPPRDPVADHHRELP